MEDFVKPHWWSTSVQAVGCWLLNHVMFYQAEKKVTVVKTEKINKMTIIFTQNGQKLSF